MSHFNPGLISAYNSLTDKHLAGYFSNTRIRRHLQRAGLITRSGRIVPDKEYRHKLIQRAHQRHVRECLAQAIFHKVLEMERLHQIEIKRKLEEFARRERVHKIKVERSRRYGEDIIRILSPHPPTGARGIRKQHSGPEGEHSESSESPGSSRPNTAPGKMQRPVRLKPIHSNSTTASLRRSSPYRLLESNDNDQPFNCTMGKESRRRLTTTEASRGISPYCLPVINNFVTPIPPATKRTERGVKVTPSGTLRGRRLRPTTASSGADVNEDTPMLRSSVHQSRVCVNVVYFGKTVHLSNDLIDMRDDVKVFQQHCGGENLCVYKGKLREGETFQFISRRHRGFPFSLTFFLNGLQVERLSSCCEFKHRKGSRLGGRHGHFGFSSVEGASPCYKCIIAMGLDKKPTPPPKRIKEEVGGEESVSSPKIAPEMEKERAGQDAAFHSDCERSQQQDTDSQVEVKGGVEEDKVRDDYEEDFEADDEGPAEEAQEKKSPSPFSETETQVKERDASETEDDEKDDINSRTGSSCSGSDQEVSNAEATKDSREDKMAEQPEEVHQEETVALADEKDETKPEEAAATEAESTVAKDSDLQDSAGDSTEIDISDNSLPSGTENKQSDDTSGDTEAEKTGDEGKQEAEQEQEQERAKSVQEKLAEAILKESQCSSEPELSDTSTEEEEEAADKDHKQNNDLLPEKSVTFTEQQQTFTEEIKCDERTGVGEVVVVQEQGEAAESKEHEDETEKEPLENSDCTKDETLQADKDDGKPVSEEEAAEKDESEETGAALHSVSEEPMTKENETLETQEDATARTTEADAAEKDEETEEKIAEAVEAVPQPNETGQETKSCEEDESSVSGLNEKTEETAVSDNVEAEAMAACETMEMKAEPSEEREALSCEEAPVTDTEERQQGDSKDTSAESETEVTAENSSSSLEGSRDTMVEKIADISEDNAKDEGSKDHTREGEAEEAAEVSKDSNQQEGLNEEQTEKSVEVDNEVEKEIAEEEGKEEGKQTDPDETPEGEMSEDKEKNETDKPKEENNESKTEERIENEEKTVEDTKTLLRTEGQTNEETAEKTLDGEEKVANEERADDLENAEKDEDGECVDSKNDEEESEAKGAVTDETNKGEEINETKTGAEEEKGDKEEKVEKDDDKNKTEQSESEKHKESEEKTIIICKTEEGEEISEVTEEPEKTADDVKILNEDAVGSEDVCDGEAADGTKTTEEMLATVMESEEIRKETEGASANSESGEIDAENGEISAEAERKTHEDEAEASAEDKNDGETAERAEDGRKTEEEPTEDDCTEVKEATADTGDDAEKHEDGGVDQAPDADMVESKAKEAGDSVEKPEEPAPKDSEREIGVTVIKEESKQHDLNKGREDDKETQQEEITVKSDFDNESKDSDSAKNKDKNVSGVIIDTSVDEAQSPTPTDCGLGGTTYKLDESAAKSDKYPPSDENAAAATGLSAADRENGADTEEASKASEEGASVLLKPQAQNDEADNAGESKEMLDAPAEEDNTDLVKNWVTTHQTSKFFETFVEPLEDWKEETPHTDVAAKSTEPLRSESPHEVVTVTENEEKEQIQKDENEAAESDLKSIHSEDGEPHENDPAKEEKEETEVKDWIPKSETEDSDDKESTKGQRKGSRWSLQDDGVQDGPKKTQNDISKTEVESTADTHHSVASGKPESVTEKQTEEKTTDAGPDQNKKQTEEEEINDLLSSSKTEEHRECVAGPGGQKDTEETNEQSGEVTEITNLTTSKSDDGSQEGSHDGEIQPKLSAGSVDGERRDAQLIQDIKHTLSKDRLSTFSVDETLFGRSSHPLLTAARTESGH